MARILVIEDETSIRRLMRQTLEQAGHEIVEAYDGDEGLRLFHRHPADLVITDLFMPRKDGWDVIAEIHRDSPGTKIISITAGLGDDCARAKELGATRTLIKPLKLQELLETVQEVL